jgi:hypothetical protein
LEELLEGTAAFTPLSSRELTEWIALATLRVSESKNRR